MGQTTREVLKGYLELGDKPTQAQFASFIDSCFNLQEDELPISQVTNLQELLDLLNQNLGIGEADINGKMHARKDGAWIDFDYIKDIIQTNIRAPFYQFKNTDTPKDYLVSDSGGTRDHLQAGGSITMLVKYRNHELGVDFGLATLGTGPGGDAAGMYLGIDDNNGLDAEIGFDTRQGVFSTGVAQDLDRWYVGALTYNGATFEAKLSLDGVLKKTRQYNAGTFANMTDGSFLGAIRATTFNGNVDIAIFQVFTDVLTQNEIMMATLNSDVVPRRVVDNLIIDMGSDKRSDKWYGRDGKGEYTNHGADLVLVPNHKRNPIVETLTLTNAPTADPAVLGKIWNDNGIAKFSAG